MQIESGLQLIARLREKPDLSKFQKHLFHAGLNMKSTIEIRGNVSSGKTAVLTQLIAKCILPEWHNDVRVNGLNRCAVLIDNDHHFLVSSLIKSMSKQVRKSVAIHGREWSPDDVENIVSTALDNLILINCYNSEQLTLTFARLESVLVNNDRVCLVAIDGLLAYYWENRDSVGIKSKDLYANHLLKKLRRHTAPFDMIVLYTRSSERTASVSASNFTKKTMFDKDLDYKICLHRRKDESFLCETWKIGQTKKVMAYVMTADGIYWME